jgi:hypothetical protein
MKVKLLPPSRKFLCPICNNAKYICTDLEGFCVCVCVCVCMRERERERERERRGRENQLQNQHQET